MRFFITSGSFYSSILPPLTGVPLLFRSSAARPLLLVAPGADDPEPVTADFEVHAAATSNTAVSPAIDALLRAFLRSVVCTRFSLLCRVNVSKTERLWARLGHSGDCGSGSKMHADADSIRTPQ